MAESVLLDARKNPGELAPRGSLRVDLEHDLSALGDPSLGGRHPLPSLVSWCQTLGRLGIGPETAVQVFDDAGGGLYAARVWWMLKAVGHAHIRVLSLNEPDQGWTGERAQALPLPPYPVSEWSLETCSIDQVRLCAKDSDWRLLDARAGERFRGEHEPLDPVAGHIPGALSMPWKEHCDLDQAKIRFGELLDGVPSNRVVVSCGSGVTACFLALQMHRLGLGIPTLYVGSWSEWCRQG